MAGWKQASNHARINYESFMLWNNTEKMVTMRSRIQLTVGIKTFWIPLVSHCVSRLFLITGFGLGPEFSITELTHRLLSDVVSVFYSPAFRWTALTFWCTCSVILVYIQTWYSDFQLLC